ncbi:MAG: MerR family transcriptional regulator [Spirochaetaceae bacterium]|nr:MAG: MerR family transcriptional regulator [Spirochaetaceae bacterium]
MRRYSIGEVCSILDVPAHTLRYWEQEIDILRPQKNDGGRRSYNEADLQLLFRLKYLLYTRKFTLSGARSQLILDADTGRSRYVASIRELRSDLFELLNTVQSVHLQSSRRSELPELLKLRSDASYLERLWRQTAPEFRTALSRTLEQLPDFWIEHVRRLCAPGRLLSDAADPSLRKIAVTETLSAVGREGSGDERTGPETLFQDKPVSVLWMPGTAEDIVRGLESDLCDRVFTLYIAALPEQARQIEAFTQRRPVGSRTRSVPRFPLPVLTSDGYPVIEREGHIRTEKAPLAEAFASATLPQVRGELLLQGVSTLGLVIGNPSVTIDPRVVSRHRQSHASLSISVRKNGARTSLAGPIWVDIGFLAQAIRPSGPATDEHRGDVVVPRLGLGSLIHRAAVANVILVE